MQVIRLPLKFIVPLLALLVTSCGFQLRGSEQVRLDPQLQVMYLGAASPNSDIVRRVQNSLEVSGATLVATPGEAPYSLWIDQEQERILTASVGGAAQATSKNLIMTVAYTVKNRDGAVVAGPEELRLEKLVQHNVLAVNASEREMSIARQDLRTRLAEQIIRQLQNLRLEAATDSVDQPK